MVRVMMGGLRPNLEPSASVEASRGPGRPSHPSLAPSDAPPGTAPGISSQAGASARTLNFGPVSHVTSRTRPPVPAKRT